MLMVTNIARDDTSMERTNEWRTGRDSLTGRGLNLRIVSSQLYRLVLT